MKPKSRETEQQHVRFILSKQIIIVYIHTYILLTPCLDMQFKMEKLLKFSEYIKDLEKRQETVCQRGL